MDEWKDITIPMSQMRKPRLRLGDLPKSPQLLSGRVGCELACSTQTLIYLHNGDLLAGVTRWHLGSGCISTFTLLPHVVRSLGVPSSNPQLPPPQSRAPGAPSPEQPPMTCPGGPCPRSRDGTTLLSPWHCGCSRARCLGGGEGRQEGSQVTGLNPAMAPAPTELSSKRG